MAISEASAQEQLQLATALLDNLWSAQTVPADQAALVAVNKGPRSAAKLIGAGAVRSATAQAVASGQAVLSAQLVDYCEEIVGKPARNAQEALVHLFQHFVDNNIFLESRAFTYGTPTTFGSSKGELKRLTVDEFGFPLEAHYAELITFKCVAEQSTGAQRFGESFLLSGANRGEDVLDIRGSGQSKLLTVASALNGLLRNPGFTSYTNWTTPTASTPTTGGASSALTDWALADPTKAQISVDNPAQVLPRVATPIVVTFTDNNSLTQLLSAGNNQVSQLLPYQSGYWVKPRSSLDGTITLAQGTNTKAYAVSGLTADTWVYLELDYDKNLWPRNWLEDAPAVSITLSSRTTGVLDIQNAFHGPLLDFDGLWYHLPAGTTPHAPNDQVSVTDTGGTSGKIQRQIALSFGRYLPSTPTVPTLTAGGSYSFTFSASGKTLATAYGSFIDDGWKVGMICRSAGTSNNNGDFPVTAVGATLLTFGGSTIVDEGPLSSVANITGLPTIPDPA